MQIFREKSTEFIFLKKIQKMRNFLELFQDLDLSGAIFILNKTSSSLKSGAFLILIKMKHKCLELFSIYPKQDQAFIISYFHPIQY